MRKQKSNPVKDFGDTLTPQDEVKRGIQVELSPAQQELFNAIRSGVRVHWMSGLNGHYFRTDWKRLDFRTADTLLKQGIVEKFDVDCRGYQLRLSPKCEL